MKIVLANPPWSESPEKSWGMRAGSRWPHSVSYTERHYLPFPFFLAHATSLLEKHTEHEVALIDAIALNMPRNDFIKKLRCPDVVVMESSTVTLKEDIITAREIKKAYPRVKVVLTGPHAMYNPQEMLDESIDFVCIGEYEYTVLELIEHIGGKKKLIDIKGIAYRQGSSFKYTGVRPTIKNLDELPFPAWEKTPLYLYNNDGFCVGQPHVFLNASRGCVFKCDFCMWPQTVYGEWKWRPFSNQYIGGMLDHLSDNYYFNEYYFDDDTFTLRPKKNMLELCSIIEEKDICWSAMTHIGTVDEEQINAMADSGLRAVKVGVESGSERILSTVLKNKGINIEKIKHTLKLYKDHGVFVHATFTLGMPEETEKDMYKTIDFAIELYGKDLIDTAQFSLTQPWPGTTMFSRLKEKGLIKLEDYRDLDGICSSVVFNESMSSGEIEEVYKLAVALKNGVEAIKRGGFENKLIALHHLKNCPVGKWPRVLKNIPRLI